jgi:hypothetical protein
MQGRHSALNVFHYEILMKSQQMSRTVRYSNYSERRNIRRLAFLGFNITYNLHLHETGRERDLAHFL